MSKKVEYNSDTLALINKLSNVCDGKIILNKDGNDIKVNHESSSKNLTFFLTANVDHFNFDDDSIAFSNFPEFYQFFTTIKDATMHHDNNLIVLSNDNSKIKYVLSDDEDIPKGPKGLNTSIESNCKFEMSNDDLKHFCKMISLLSSSKDIIGLEVNVKIENNKMLLTIQGDIEDSCFEKTFDLIEYDDCDISFNIPAEYFTVIPSGDYVINVWEQGIVISELKNDNINLKIMTAELVERD
jgi:hypothetical protein